MMERVVPWDESAESAVLGAMLINPTAIPVAAEMLTAGDFYKTSDGKVFDAIVARWLDDETSVDQITIGNQFPKDRDYIFHLAASCPGATSVRHYADIVRHSATSRNLIRVGNEIADLGYDTDMEVSKLVDTAESKLSGIRKDNANHQHRVSELTFTVLESIKSGEKPKMIATGFDSIDKYAKGLYGSQLIILGARPGVGKTCLGLSVAQRVASVGGTVAYFSLEMRASELTERLLASLACVSLTKIRERSVSPDELAEVNKAKSSLDECDLQIIDDSTLSMLGLASKVRTMAKKDLKLVVVDYLQLMSLGAKAENRREEVSEMSRKLKALAMEVDVPIMALSQLNRVSTFEGAKVDISQLKETGSLEQDADMVWLMDWPKGDSGFGDQKTVEVKIAKNRNGPMGTAELIWVPQYQRYEE
jgi:replicative DNA helicase